MSQPNLTDFVVGFDPTSQTTITGAQLAQLVNSATPNTDRGLILVTVDVAGSPQVPNVNGVGGNVNWGRYMWIRQSTTYVTAYVWNPNGATDPTFQNWTTLSSASIGANTIQGYMISPLAITDGNIHDVNSSKITGSVVAGWLALLDITNSFYAIPGLMSSNSAVFGDLNGAGSTVGQPKIGNLKVLQGNLALQSVAGGAAGSGQIVDNSITKLQLLSNGNAGSTALLNAAVDPANNVIVPTTSQIGTPIVTPAPQAIAAGDVVAVAYNKTGYVTMSKAILATLVEPTVQTYPQVPVVTSGGKAYALSAAQGANAGVPFGRMLQRYQLLDNSVITQGTPACDINTLPTTTNCLVLASLTAALFTPLRSDSTIVVEVLVYGSNTAAGHSFTIGLFQDATVNAVAAAFSPTPYTANQLTLASINYSFASSAGLVAAGTTLKVGFAPDYGTARYNAVAAATKLFGGTLGINSMIRITEYI